MDFMKLMQSLIPIPFLLAARKVPGHAACPFRVITRIQACQARNGGTLRRSPWHVASSPNTQCNRIAEAIASSRVKTIIPMPKQEIVASLCVLCRTTAK